MRRRRLAPIGSYLHRQLAWSVGGSSPMARRRHNCHVPPIDALIPELAAPGADCLNLNIWSRDLGSAGQPVMVWIPGGILEVGTGAAHWYDGSRFARDGIVCVTINYRVAADGFLYLGEGTANLGLLDQIAALALGAGEYRSLRR